MTAQTEPHPWFHDWDVTGDFVHKATNRGKVKAIRRMERCPYCGKERRTVIDIPSWTVRYRSYIGKVKVVRLTKPEYLKRAFMRSTPLTDEELTAMGLR